MDKIEKMLREYDKADDNGNSYREYHKEIYEVYYEPNMFEVD